MFWGYSPQMYAKSMIPATVGYHFLRTILPASLPEQPSVQPLIDIHIRHREPRAEDSPGQHVRRIVHALVHAREAHRAGPQRGGGDDVPLGVSDAERRGQGKGCGSVARREGRVALQAVRSDAVGIALVGTGAVHDILQAIGQDEGARHAGAHVEGILQQVAVVLYPTRQSHGQGNAHDDVGFGAGYHLIIITDKSVVPAVDLVHGADVPALRQEGEQGGEEENEEKEVSFHTQKQDCAGKDTESY